MAEPERRQAREGPERVERDVEAHDPSHDPHRDHATIRRLADELLPALMSRLEASPLGELEVSQDGWRVRLRKPVEQEAPAGASIASPPASVRGGSSERAAAPASSPARSTERADRPRRVITSPAVGTFHPRAGTSLGKAVRAGDVVGHVEVLGVPQEVLAPFDGTLGRVLVEPGQVVEYGEQLIRIDASGPAPAAAAADGAGSAQESR